MKMLFDENFGLPLVKAMKGVIAFSRDPVEVRHISELRHSGRRDEEWVPEVAANGWLVLSADRGRRSAGPKLPSLCRAHAITHALVSGGLHAAPQFEKARAVLAVWPGLLAAFTAPAGTRFSLRYSHERTPVLVRFAATTSQP